MKSFVFNAGLKGTFCCVRSSRKKFYNICNYSYKMFSYSMSYFSSERDLGKVKIVSYILKSLFFFFNVKIVSPDKRQSHTLYMYTIYNVWWRVTLNWKKKNYIINISQNLNIKLDIFLWKIQVQIISMLKV